MRRTRLIALAALAAVLGTLVAAYVLVRPRLTAAERGRRLAEANGCFGCHGPEGIRGIPNPGREEKVPDYEGMVMMYAEDEEEVREWIRDGVTRSRRESESWKADRDRGALRMPAFGKRLSAGEIEDLVAYVMALSGLLAPDDSAARHGLDRADALGCTGCHGAGGRLGRPNPGSFKGYIPSWDGADFPELVRDRNEFREWVEEGVGRRFRANPVATFFLRRAPVHMPAFKNHLEPGDVDALWAYVRWLRSATPRRPVVADPPG